MKNEILTDPNSHKMRHFIGNLLFRLENTLFSRESNISVASLLLLARLMNLQLRFMPNTKKKTLIKTLALTIIVFSAIWTLFIPTSNASKTITVPQDFLTINEAISHASEGDVISVKSGVYYENLKINKSISIVG
jgi:hypothetical protein